MKTSYYNVVKRAALIVLLQWIAVACAGQDMNPITWRFGAKKVNDRTYEVRLQARLNPPWHIYAQKIPEGTAMPTLIRFDQNPLVVLEGLTSEEGHPEKIQEEGQWLTYYSKQVSFIQVVKLKAGVKTTLSGSVHFMVCTHERCLPPAEKKFSIILDGRN